MKLKLSIFLNVKINLEIFAMFNQESHNSLRRQTADFVYYQVQLQVSLLFVLSDPPLAVVLRTLVYIEVVAARKLIAIHTYLQKFPEQILLRI